MGTCLNFVFSFHPKNKNKKPSLLSVGFSPSNTFLEHIYMQGLNVLFINHADLLFACNCYSFEFDLSLSSFH